MVIGLLKSKDLRTWTGEKGNYTNSNIVVQVYVKDDESINVSCSDGDR